MLKPESLSSSQVLLQYLLALDTVLKDESPSSRRNAVNLPAVRNSDRQIGWKA